MLGRSFHMSRFARRRLGRRAATHALVVSAVCVTVVSLLGHEGHDTAPQRPLYRQVQAGDTTYRVGLAMLPQDPLVGEDVRFAVHVRHQDDAAPAVDVSNAELRVIPAGEAPSPLPYVSPGDKPGTVSAVHRFEEDGQYSLGVELQSGSGLIRADFPLAVRPGPVARAPWILDALVLIGVAGFVVARSRRRAPDGPAMSLTGADAAIVAVGLVVLVVGHVLIAPRVGRLFLPERHFGPIAWELPAGKTGVPGTAPAPHTHPPGTPPHSHDEAAVPEPNPVTTAGEVASVVVPVPGRLVEVVVPVTARVVFDDFVPRPGRVVRRGQTIATLEHHFILHDAVHLVNQRWPYVLEVFKRKREHLAAQLNLVRLRHLQDAGEPAVREMMKVTQAVTGAEAAVAEAALEQTRAEKLLAMHDAQIAKRDLVRRPVEAPIAGTIDAVHFTQGELKYENDRLMTILDLSQVWVEARFPEDHASRPMPRVMMFVSPAFPGRTFQGRLARVAKTLDPATRTVSAFFEVHNPDRFLRLGMRLAGRADQGAAGAAATRGAVPARLDADPQMPPLSLAATVTPAPELTAEVTAPLWGRIEFAGRRLNVGDQVRKGEQLLNVILELSVDERYPMEARALDIAAEHELSKARRAQAEQQYHEALELLKANPSDRFRQQELAAMERIRLAAQQEEILLARQVEAFQGTMKRRDPKTTVIEAPISGVISSIGFTPGELNRTGEFRRLLTIVDTSRVLLEAPIYAHQIPAVLDRFPGASFVSPGLPGARPLKAPIAVSGAIDPETGALRALFEAPNPTGALKIGASARILIPRN